MRKQEIIAVLVALTTLAACGKDPIRAPDTYVGADSSGGRSFGGGGGGFDRGGGGGFGGFRGGGFHGRR